MRNHTEGRVTASIRPQREGPVFVAVPSKAVAQELAADLMGVSPVGRALALALRKACEATDEDDAPQLPLGTTPGSTSIPAVKP